MDRKIISMMSILCLLGASTTASMAQDASSQKLTTTSSSPQTTKDIFRVGIAVLGVTKDTGNIFSFVNVGGETSARFYNASRDDLNDKDGVVESVISFPNQTVNKGANFTACNVVLKNLIMECKSGINLIDRTEVIQFLLPSFKPAPK